MARLWCRTKCRRYLEICLTCEPVWRERPLRSCCCCVRPLRRGALLTTLATAMLCLFVVLPVAIVLRGRTFFRDESFADLAGLPLSVLLLRYAYMVCIFWSLFAAQQAVVALAALGHGALSAGRPITGCGGRCGLSLGLAPPLALSRVLRLGTFLFLGAFLTTNFHAADVCMAVGRDAEVAALAHACSCQRNSSWHRVLLEGGSCEARRYHRCELDRAAAEAAGSSWSQHHVLIAGHSNLTLHQALQLSCRSCGALHPGGSSGVNATVQPQPQRCTAALCTAAGDGQCTAAAHRCPATAEEYAAEHASWPSSREGWYPVLVAAGQQQGINNGQLDECRYDSEGWLTSLAFRDGHETESAAAVTQYLEAGAQSARRERAERAWRRHRACVNRSGWDDARWGHGGGGARRCPAAAEHGAHDGGVTRIAGGAAAGRLQLFAHPGGNAGLRDRGGAGWGQSE
jgi:hypothetical protein